MPAKTFVIALISLCWAGLSAAEIQVYLPCQVKRDYPETVTVYHINCNQQLDQLFTRQIRNNHHTQLSDALQNQATEYVHDHYKQYKKAYQANDQAAAAGIKRLPAIVFDQEYVVYGTTDLDQARDYYQKRRQQ